MSWQFLDAKSRFEEFRQLWDELNSARDNHILLDSGFVAPLIRHFGSKNTVLAVNPDGSKSAIALLTKTGPGQWTTFQPSQAPLGMIIFGYNDRDYEGLRHLLRSLPGMNLTLSVLQQDPSHSSFDPCTTADTVDIVQYIDTPQTILAGNFEEYWRGRSRNLKHNLDRQNRRIREQGRRLELVAIEQKSHIAAGIREYANLESAGWKALGGTAIREDNVQGRFYRAILENFAERGEAVLFQLILDGKVAASDLCLSRAGTLVVLKTAYDETVEQLSPALLMRREILKYLYARSHIQNIEFYGRVLPWHAQWMTAKRSMFHINLFRNKYVMPAREILRTFRWSRAIL